MENELFHVIQEKKIIAIVRGIPANMILDTAKALSEGGVHLMEITFDQSSPEGIENTLLSIRTLKEHLPAHMRIGAGTVLTPKQVQNAYDCGAEYIISPNINRQVIEKTKELGMISMPGAFTPSEVVDAYEWGADIIKLFPAGILGISYIKAVMAPLSHIPLAAVGGVDPDNIREFLKAGVTCFGIGSNLVNKSLITSKNFADLTLRAKTFVDALK